MAESTMVARDVELAALTGARLHVAHVSVRDSLAAIRRARAARVPVSCEVTPHHLLLNDRSEMGALAKANPPLRSRDDQAALWSALASGAIDSVGSDHAPHTLEEKRAAFEEAPSGVPGVETGFPLMLKAVKDGRLSLARCVDACCAAPARRIGANKGKIAVGYDADIVAVSMREVVKITDEAMHSKCGWTPFAGMEAIFPKMAMVRGRAVVRNGALEAERAGALLPARA